MWRKAPNGATCGGNTANLEDALLVGGFLNTLLRQSERVRVGCLAQLVNVIAPLVTNETSVLRQGIYFPYAWALKYARGNVLDLLVESETYPIYAKGLRADFARNDEVPYVDLTATLDPDNGRVCLCMLNRDLQAERELVVAFRDPTPKQVLTCETLTGSDLKAFNTFERPTAVSPRALDAPAAGSQMTFKLPARSDTVAQLATA